VERRRFGRLFVRDAIGVRAADDGPRRCGH
jgi:hypothetical protein